MNYYVYVIDMMKDFSKVVDSLEVGSPHHVRSYFWLGGDRIEQIHWGRIDIEKTLRKISKLDFIASHYSGTHIKTSGNLCPITRTYLRLRLVGFNNLGRQWLFYLLTSNRVSFLVPAVASPSYSACIQTWLTEINEISYLYLKVKIKLIEHNRHEEILGTSFPLNPLFETKLTIASKTNLQTALSSLFFSLTWCNIFQYGIKYNH